jgi:hypothetical protein
MGGFQTALNKTLSDIISSFKTNLLLLNFNKAYYLEFRTQNCIYTILYIDYFHKTIVYVPYKKFLGVVIVDTLLWDNYIDQLLSKLNSACYALRAVKAMWLRKALRMLYVSWCVLTHLIVLKHLECKKNF